VSVRLRRSTPQDLAFVTRLERLPEHLDAIGQWSDEEHLAAIERRGNREHFIVERDGVAAGYLIFYDGRTRSPSVYLKRILVAEKERGTGRQAVARFLEEAFGREGVDFAWLVVRNGNARAQAVYRKVGFERYEPAAPEAIALAGYAEEPGEGCFRMRLDGSPWRTRRRG